MFKAFSAAALVATVGGVAHAATILEYQTAASTSNATLPASFADAGIVADDFAAGSGIDAANGGTYNFNNWADDPGDVSNPTAVSALAENEFFSFGFDVTAVSVDLDSFELRLDRSGTGPNQVEIFAQVNGTGSLISLLTFDWGDGSGGEEFTGVSLASVPTLVTGDSIEFFVVAFGEDSGGASNFGTFDLETIDFGGSDPRAVRVFGDVVVPEPASMALLAAGLAVAGLRRRSA